MMQQGSIITQTQPNIPITRQIAVLAKAPHIGQVKTRLTQESAKQSTQQNINEHSMVLSHWQALQFHQWSLKAVIQDLCPTVLKHRPLLFVTQEHSVWSTLDLDQAPYLQTQGHLGIKMYDALHKSFQTLTSDHALEQTEKQDAVLLLGTDSPHLNPDELTQGLDFLNQQTQPALVIGPAEDGGYYTIGCNRPALEAVKALFLNEIRWGSDQVFSDTLAIAQSLALEIKILAKSYDIDRPQDLYRARHTEALAWAEFETLLHPHELAAPQEPSAYQAYQQALSRLFDLTRFGERMDLSTPKAMNQALGDPLSQYKNILIGGTNGKGSTSAALTQIGLKLGKKVGCFTSPHLVSFRERIRIGDELITHQEVAQGVKVIFELAEQENLTLSFFEATWALAAWCFQQRQVDWVIWEVGLGGRLDATNVCEPVLSAITSISLDHTHILGDTLADIAGEKSPIYRSNGVALTACKDEALAALMSVSKVSPQSVEADIQALEARYQGDLGEAQDKKQELEHAGSLMMNQHGRRNLALALRCAQELGWLDQEWLESGGKTTFIENRLSLNDLWSLKWPGRLEYLEDLWLDCAHNPDSALYLAEWLSQQSRARHLIVGMSADKDVSEVLLTLAQQCEQLTFVSPKYPRCASAETLAEVFETQVIPKLKGLPSPVCIPNIIVEPNLTQAFVQRDTHALNLVCGSCFLVGEARAFLLGVEFPELGLSTTAR